VCVAVSLSSLRSPVLRKIIPGNINKKRKRIPGKNKHHKNDEINIQMQVLKEPLIRIKRAMAHYLANHLPHTIHTAHTPHTY